MTLKQIEKKLENLKKLKNKTEQDIGKLQGQKINLVLNKIKTRALREQPWIVYINNLNKIFLTINLKDGSSLEKFTRDIRYNSKHYEITLDSSEFVVFNHDEITIAFKDLEQCIFFVKKYKLSLNFSVMENNMEYYSNQLDFHDNILNTLKNIK